MQSASQKEDLASYFGEQKYSKNLDYISLWFLKGADYIRGTAAQLAFVSTNSITQGDHVGLLFPFVLTGGIEISYAYTSFKWSNNASHNAGVTVIVLSLRNSSDSPKLLFSDGIEKQVKHINAYLAEGDDVIVTKRRQPLSHQLPQMTYGSKPTDGGHLILEPEDVEKLLAAYPESEKFIKQYVGSSEYIRGNDRFCLWIEDDCVTEAQHIPAIAKRLERVRDERLRSKALSTVEFAEQPHRFKQRSYKPTDSIIVPSVSSERRDYVPVGYLDANTVISNLAFAVYDAEPWLFALLTSKMHMAWLRAVGGQLETRLRYSNTLVYNTFPVPELSASSKEELTKRALRVLDVREYHCEKTLAELYDPDLMPRNLREAHEKIDEAVDRLYKSTPFASDEERLAVLFAKYQQMIEAEGK